MTLNLAKQTFFAVSASFALGFGLLAGVIADGGERSKKPTSAKVLDSAIVAGISLFSTLISLGWPPTIQVVYVAGLTGMLAFLVQFAGERGIRRYESGRSKRP